MAAILTAKRVSIMFDAGRQKTQFLKVDIGQRILVLSQLIRIVGWNRDGEVRRHARGKQPCPAQFIDARQVAHFLQAEMIEE